MRTIILNIILLIQGNLFGQSNLVLNYSLEDWSNHFPSHWNIEQNTVDIFKLDYKLIPFGVKKNNLKFRSKFPSKGSHGITYSGLAVNEIISCTLKQPLKQNTNYELSFYIYNPPIYTDRKTNKFTVKFETDKGFSKPILISHFEEIDTSSYHWHKVSRIIRGNGSEKKLHCGFFGDYYKDHPYNTAGLYYLFDEITLSELCSKTDTINIFFDQGSKTTNSNSLASYFSSDNYGKYEMKIKVFGFASRDGESDMNYELSRMRCEHIDDQLSQFNKIEIDTIIAYGEGKQLSNKLEDNRLVQVVIEYKESCHKSPMNTISTKSNVIANKLKEMNQTDQQIRLSYDSLLNINRKDSMALKKMELAMEHIDSINQHKLFEILDSLSYPGISKVGVEFMDVPFLILQHANLDKRLKYESLLLDAVSKGEATKTWIPYMIDRNLVDQDKNQIYGTQLFWNKEENKYVPFEIDNLKNVDELRNKYRLGSLEKYLKYVNEN